MLIASVVAWLMVLSVAPTPAATATDAIRAFPHSDSVEFVNHLMVRPSPTGGLWCVWYQQPARSWSTIHDVASKRRVAEGLFCRYLGTDNPPSAAVALILSADTSSSMLPEPRPIDALVVPDGLLVATSGRPRVPRSPGLYMYDPNRAILVSIGKGDRIDSLKLAFPPDPDASWLYEGRDGNAHWVTGEFGESTVHAIVCTLRDSLRLLSHDTVTAHRVTPPTWSAGVVGHLRWRYVRNAFAACAEAGRDTVLVAFISRRDEGVKTTASDSLVTFRLKAHTLTPIDSSKCQLSEAAGADYDMPGPARAHLAPADTGYSFVLSLNGKCSAFRIDRNGQVVKGVRREGVSSSVPTGFSEPGTTFFDAIRTGALTWALRYYLLTPDGDVRFGVTDTARVGGHD